MSRAPFIGFVLSLSFLADATAQEEAPPPTFLGAGIWSRPAYDGDDSGQTLTLIPAVRHYGAVWFARTTMGLLEGGARTEAAKGFALGAHLAYEGGRTSDESDFLAARNLPDLHPSASLGVHAELKKDIGPMPVIALLRYRQDIDDERGAQADLRLTAGVFSGGGLNAGVFFQTTWADDEASQFYYGITPQQAAISGLPAYSPQGGQLFNAVGVLGSYALTPRWLLLGSFELRRLRGDALGSPLVQTDDSRYASLSLAYVFQGRPR
jgi:outer membrane scaffolding protein for murein synthesis (MipA/OmpV family)